MPILHGISFGLCAIFMVCCGSTIRACFPYGRYGEKASGPSQRSNYCSCCGREIDHRHNTSQEDWDRLSTISEADTVFSDSSSVTLTYDQPQANARFTMPTLIDLS